MIPGLTARHTLMRERPTMVDDGRGGLEPDFTGTTAVPLTGWALDPGVTVKDMVNRDAGNITWTARGPHTADVERHDRIIIAGDQYKINGEVVRYPGPTPMTSHTILLLERWSG